MWLKISCKEDLVLLSLVFYFSLKVRMAMRFTAKTRGCLNTKFRSGLRVWVAKYVVPMGHVTTKFPRIDRFSFSTVMDAPLREFRSRELRY